MNLFGAKKTQAELDRLLMEAIWDKKVKKVRHLCDKGADINCKKGLPLTVAIERDAVDCIHELIKRGVSVTPRNRFLAGRRGYEGLVV